MERKRNYLLIVLLALAILLPARTAKADHEDDVHAIAHIGASFTIELITYGISHKALKLSRPASLIVATATTLLVGFAYKYSETHSASFNREMSKSMFRNGIGVGLGIASIELFSF